MADFGLSKIFQPSIYHSDDDKNIANENGVLMENCSLGDIGGSNTTGCNSYHGSLLARSESIDDSISQRMRSSTRSCCGTLVSFKFLTESLFFFSIRTIRSDKKKF